ncbi:MAG: hypothetical protein AAF598_19030 [Bacteroidota bacterium]
MSDLEKHELDQLFQQGVEQYDFAFNKEAWEDMEQLLDKDKRRRILLWVLLGGLLLVVSIGGYLAFGGSLFQQAVKDLSPKIGLSEQTVNPSDPTQGADTKAVDPDQLNRSDLPIQAENFEESTTTEPIDQKDGSNAQNRVDQAITNSSATSTTPAEADPSRPTDQQGDSKFTENQSLLNTTANDPTATLTDSTVQQPEQPSLNNETNQRQDGRSENQNVEIGQQEDTKRSEVFADPVDSKNISIAFDSEDPAFPASDPVPQDNRRKKPTEFTIGLRAGLEMVSAGTDDFGEFSYHFGLDTEYRFARNWSLGLGGHISRKIYQAQMEDYKAPMGFWTRGIAADNTEAACTILEIPLSASYYFNGYQRNGFYAKGGMTTYFMLREEYLYNYNNPEPDLRKQWREQNGSRHYFALLHFATGFQQRIGRSYSIQYEPYLQVPLSGVGHGDVKLFTIGTAIRFNFGFD